MEYLRKLRHVMIIAREFPPVCVRKNFIAAKEVMRALGGEGLDEMFKGIVGGLYNECEPEDVHVFTPLYKYHYIRENQKERDHQSFKKVVGSKPTFREFLDYFVKRFTNERRYIREVLRNPKEPNIPDKFLRTRANRSERIRRKIELYKQCFVAKSILEEEYCDRSWEIDHPDVNIRELQSEAIKRKREKRGRKRPARKEDCSKKSKKYRVAFKF